MNPNDIPEAGWTWSLFAVIGEWLPLVVYLAGLAVAIWAFRRCRKCGYLVIAAYFAGIVLWSYVWLPIHRSIEAHRPPDQIEQIQEQMDKQEQQAVIEARAKAGQPIILNQKRIYFSVGPILLVAGLWFVARRETPVS